MWLVLLPERCFPFNRQSAYLDNKIRRGATRIAGGFNKAKLTYGKSAVGNRYVIVRWDSLQSYETAWNGGGKAWIEKNAPDARQVIVEGIEAK
jgi:hypothetical protein